MHPAGGLVVILSQCQVTTTHSRQLRHDLTRPTRLYRHRHTVGMRCVEYQVNSELVRRGLQLMGSRLDIEEAEGRTRRRLRNAHKMGI